MPECGKQKVSTSQCHFASTLQVLTWSWQALARLSGREHLRLLDHHSLTAPSLPISKTLVKLLTICVWDRGVLVLHTACPAGMQ